MNRRNKMVLLLALVTALAFAGRGPLAETLLARAQRERVSWHLASAQRLARASAALGSNEARLELAEIHLFQGEIRRALAELERAQDDPSIRQYLLLGTARFLGNDAAGATIALERVVLMARATRDARMEARAHTELSRVRYHLQGASEDAKAHLTHALRLARDLRDPHLEAGALRHLGVVRLRFDRDPTGAAKEYLVPALALYRRLGDPHGEAATLANIAITDRHRGSLIDCYEHLQASLAISHRIGDRAGMVQSLALLGNLHTATKNYRKARHYNEQSLSIARATGFLLGESDSEAELVHTLVSFDEIDAALVTLKRLVDRDRKNPLLTKYRVGRIADCLMRKGEHAAALDRIREVLRLDAQIGQPDHWHLFIARVWEADALARLGLTTEASQAFEKAMAVGSARQLQWDITPIPAAVRAEIFMKEGRKNEALSHIERRVDYDLSQLVVANSQFAEIQDQRHYDRIFELLLNDPRPEPRQWVLAWRYLEQIRARSFQSVIGRGDTTVSKDHLAARANTRALARRLLTTDARSEGAGVLYATLENELLRSGFQFARSGGGRHLPITLSQLQSRLDAGTVVAEFVMTSRRAWVIAITRSGISASMLPATPPEIAARIRLLHHLFDTEAPAERWQPVASDLHRILIAPLDLRSADRLVVVPYAFLRDVPFAALIDDGGTFLVDRLAISMIPNASMIEPARPKNARGVRGVSVGASGVSRANLPRLAFAEREALTVADLGGGFALVGNDATEAAVKRLAVPVAFLHVASHAVIETDMPLLGRIELVGGEDEDGSLTVPEILELGLDADLVTLSSCRSSTSLPATGRKLAEAGRVGLLDAFLFAGSRSVVAALLPVSDRAAAALMTDFYALDRTLPKSEALAQAQRKMRRGDLSHPRHWAPFVLMGDGR